MFYKLIGKNRKKIVDGLLMKLFDMVRSSRFIESLLGFIRITFSEKGNVRWFGSGKLTLALVCISLLINLHVWLS